GLVQALLALAGLALTLRPRLRSAFARRRSPSPDRRLPGPSPHAGVSARVDTRAGRVAPPIHTEALFWTAVGVGAMALMWPGSEPLWEAVPPLAYAEFAWRLVPFVCLATAFLTGALVTALPSSGVGRPASVVRPPTQSSVLSPQSFVWWGSARGLAPAA